MGARSKPIGGPSISGANLPIEGSDGVAAAPKIWRSVFKLRR